MTFNSDPKKQAQDVAFFKKKTLGNLFSLISTLINLWLPKLIGELEL